MLMTVIWLLMLAVSIIFASFTGNTQALSQGLFTGAEKAVELCLSILGPVCLWSGVLELMEQSGLAGSLSRLFSPLLRRIFPRSFEDRTCSGAISANFTANLLGLGNAATPAGLRAVETMKTVPGAENELCRLVVINSSSLQLIPATLAAVRASLGAASPFDILPCVWLTSIAALSAGLVSAYLLEGRRA